MAHCADVSRRVTARIDLMEVEGRPVDIEDLANPAPASQGKTGSLEGKLEQDKSSSLCLW